MNVNSHGRVCHAILEGDYGVDVSVKDILSFVYDALLCPDVETATDTNSRRSTSSTRARRQQAVGGLRAPGHSGARPGPGAQQARLW